MASHRRIWWILLAYFFIMPASELTAQSHSGLDRPPYELVVSQMKKVARSSESGKLVNYGHSQTGKALWLLQFGPRQKPVRHGVVPGIVVTGGMHGTEYMHIVDRMPRWLAAAAEQPGAVSQFLEAGVIYVVPVLNPEGFGNGGRGNGKIIDLNRDFGIAGALKPRFTQPESRSLGRFFRRQAVENNVNLQLAMDYHCCKGALLLPSAVAASQQDRAAHQTIAHLMQQNVDSRYQAGTTPDILGYAPAGTLKDFFHKCFGALSFTFEGMRLTETRKFGGHTKWLSAIAGYLSYRGPTFRTEAVSE